MTLNLLNVQCAPTVMVQHPQMLKDAFKDRYQKARDTDDWEAEAKFERLHAQRELYPKFKQE